MESTLNPYALPSASSAAKPIPVLHALTSGAQLLPLTTELALPATPQQPSAPLPIAMATGGRNEGRHHPDEAASIEKWPRQLQDEIGMEFVLIPAGTFRTGGSGLRADPSEKPRHEVTITRPFYIGKYEVTQGQWQAAMGSNPSFFDECGERCPVDSVSWFDAQAFTGRLNEMEGINSYRLPSEPEWDYAVRAGSNKSQYGPVDEIAWHRGNDSDRTHPVGGKLPRAFGLRDTLGNVAEWCRIDSAPTPRDRRRTRPGRNRAATAWSQDSAGSARVSGASAVASGFGDSLPAVDEMPNPLARPLPARSWAASSATVPARGGTGETRASASAWRKPFPPLVPPGGHCNEAFTSRRRAVRRAGARRRGTAAKRKPRNALEDINRIGHRNVTGVLNFFTLRQEVELGSALARQVNERVQLVDDPAISEYVNRIGQNIARNSDVKVPLAIKVLRDETVNAFDLPGGFFYINSGLILAARDEAELAGVMGTRSPTSPAATAVRQASRGMLASLTVDILLEAFGGDNWGLVAAVTAANIALPVTFLKFSREFEKKADFLGMQYLYKTGYDPLAMVSFFERLSARKREKTGFIAAAFRTHPLSSKRVMLLQKATDELLPDQPTYMVSTSEFDAVKARIAELHGTSEEDPDDPEQPEFFRRLSGADGASKSSQ